MEIVINLLGKIIAAYDVEEYDEVSCQNRQFELALDAEYNGRTCSERCWIDNIRQTFLMASTGFPVKQLAIDKARRYYEMMKVY